MKLFIFQLQVCYSKCGIILRNSISKVSFSNLRILNLKIISKALIQAE